MQIDSCCTVQLQAQGALHERESKALYDEEERGSVALEQLADDGERMGRETEIIRHLRPGILGWSKQLAALG